MCFSAEADLVGGIIVSGVGVDALRNVRHKREIAIAALPVVFGLHQIIEAFTWWSLEGRLGAAIGDVSTAAYLAIAFSLPVAVPLALALIEPNLRRTRWMLPFVALGAVISAILLAEVVSGPVSAEIATRYIAYHPGLSYGGQITVLYVIATCAPLLMSTVRRFVVFGLFNLVAVTALGWLTAAAVISLWCAWAAVTSIVIAIHFRTSQEQPTGVAVVT
jgi:hypothetical protein